MTAVSPTSRPRLLSITRDDGPRATPLSIVVFPGRIGISPEEFAEATHTGRTNVYLALQRGEIPHKRVGRRIIIPLSALDRWFTQDDPDAA